MDHDAGSGCGCLSTTRARRLVCFGAEEVGKAPLSLLPPTDARGGDDRQRWQLRPACRERSGGAVDDVYGL